MIHKCFNEFRCGRTSKNDDQSLGPPSVLRTPEMIEKRTFVNEKAI